MDRTSLPLMVSSCELTEAFQEIGKHTAVCFEDGGLVALVGPANDPESIRFASLFASAPDQFKALIRARQLLEDMAGHWPGTMAIDAKETYKLVDHAITMAEGN